MNGFIKYEKATDIEIGDTVCHVDSIRNHGWNAFATSIIVDIDRDNWCVRLVRPHLRAEKIGCCRGDAMIMTERYNVGIDMLIESYRCHTTGESYNKDNRKFQ